MYRTNIYLYIHIYIYVYIVCEDESYTPVRSVVIKFTIYMISLTAFRTVK